MPAPRRGRACDACHTIKIRCELGSIGGEPPCQRCIRLEKSCSISPPVRKKDRIAELEAKLEEMTKLLRLQEIQDPSSSTPPISVARSETSSKKRRLDSTLPQHEHISPDQSCLEMDDVVSVEIQRQLYYKYRNDIEPVFPFSITKSYEDLRENHPLLLQAILFAACPGTVPPEIQDEVTSILMKLLSPDEVVKAKKSIELIQAILIASFWYRPPKSQVHIAIDRFLNLATSISTEIGIVESDCALSTDLSNSGPDQVSSSEAWRTWNMCYLLSASLGSCMRIPPTIPWTSDLEMKLSSLEYGRDALNTDEILCQVIRSERLCQQIIVEAGYNGSELMEATDHAKIQRIKNLIKDRKVQIFSSLGSPSLTLYEHIATMFLHECILHTPTNRRSFAAPYVAERLSSTDFPAPTVTPDHVSSMYGLRDACHAALDIILTLDIGTIVYSPVIVLSAKTFYAQWLLVKLYIAVTATGNTYGAFIDPQSLEVENYLGKLADLGERICAIDEAFVAGRGLLSSKRLREWIRNYDALQSEESFTTFPAASTHLELDVGFGTSNIDWTTFDLTEYGLEDLFGTIPEQSLVDHHEPVIYQTT